MADAAVLLASSRAGYATGHLAASISTVKAQVLGVAQCCRVLDSDALPGASRACDGVNLLTLTDLDTIAASMRLPEHIAVMLPDELEVCSGYVSGFSMAAGEHLLYARPIIRARGCICVITFRRARPGLDRLSSASPGMKFSNLRPLASLSMAYPRCGSTCSTTLRRSARRFATLGSIGTWRLSPTSRRR
jgi:hypothetical protein